jgi:hypothetical protein
MRRDERQAMGIRTFKTRVRDLNCDHSAATVIKGHQSNSKVTARRGSYPAATARVHRVCDGERSVVHHSEHIVVRKLLVGAERVEPSIGVATADDEDVAVLCQLLEQLGRKQLKRFLSEVLALRKKQEENSL